MLGIRGGREIALAVLASSAPNRVLESMIQKVMIDKIANDGATVEQLRGFEQVVS
jgi:hypothetical protein